ncbi:hypothetical protein TNCV_4422011 [Trichonephila clavipes]|nr:hypothetical protein TNCV_4422011 [Trichonephila clavipes]
MSHEWAPVDSIPQRTQHALLSLTAAFHSDANNIIDVLTVEAGIEVELLTVSSCPVVDKENDLIFCRSYIFRAFLVGKSAAGRSYDTEVLLFVYLTIDRS